MLALACHPALSHPHLGVTVRYEEELYSVEEEAGYVTLALVLEGDTAIPVTVSVNTLDLLNSSVRDAATGELFTHPKTHRRKLMQLHGWALRKDDIIAARSWNWFHLNEYRERCSVDCNQFCA